jgi:hypothetical protein
MKTQKNKDKSETQQKTQQPVVAVMKVDERPDRWTVGDAGGSYCPRHEKHTPAREVHAQARGAHAPARAVQAADREVTVES